MLLVAGVEGMVGVLAFVLVEDEFYWHFHHFSLSIDECVVSLSLYLCGLLVLPDMDGHFVDDGITD